MEEIAAVRRGCVHSDRPIAIRLENTTISRKIPVSLAKPRVLISHHRQRIDGIQNSKINLKITSMINSEE